MFNSIKIWWSTPSQNVTQGLMATLISFLVFFVFGFVVMLYDTGSLDLELEHTKHMANAIETPDVRLLQRRTHIEANLMTFERVHDTFTDPEMKATQAFMYSAYVLDNIDIWSYRIPPEHVRAFLQRTRTADSDYDIYAQIFRGYGH